ncbi:unnamed protein product [Anisakis simplex]|uniref:Uncharacterized protein n=1 Tax=Anisakis simplex TaxID=6269 RepID=A0A3P6PDK4_ANISI|nr:unnamed protein product [Anisakis simplex]
MFRYSWREGSSIANYCRHVSAGNTTISDDRFVSINSHYASLPFEPTNCIQVWMCQFHHFFILHLQMRFRSTIHVEHSEAPFMAVESFVRNTRTQKSKRFLTPGVQSADSTSKEHRT